MRDPAFDDAGALVFDSDTRPLETAAQFDCDFGQYARFLKGVQRVVDRLVDSGGQSLG